MAATEDVLTAALRGRWGGAADAVSTAPLRRGDSSRYGTDRADMRFGLEIRDLGEALGGTEFKVFRGALEGGGVVRGINAGAHELSRAELDKLIEFAQGQGAGGLVWAYVEEGGGWRSPVAEVPLRRRACARSTSALEA